MLKKSWQRFLDSPYQTLMLLRLLVMLCIVCGYAYFPHSNKIFNLMAFLLFILSYFCILWFSKWRWLFFVLELIICFIYASISLGLDFPYQLLIGLVGVGLFLYYGGAGLYISWSLLFFLLLGYELVFDLQSVAGILINYSFIVFASITGGLIRYSYKMKNVSNRLYLELTASYQQLREHAETVEQLAIQEERNRIAREIHDTVGHTVTALIFQLEAAQKYMYKDQKKSLAIMNTSEELARSIYQEIRFSIEENNQEGWRKIDLVTLLKQLVDDFSRLTQLQVYDEIKGKVPSALSPKYKFSLYRILQETLTNAKRHGFAEHVWITLTFQAHHLHVLIKDDGIGVEVLQLGFGLRNLQRRVEDLGGECHFYTGKKEGFRTEILLPLEEKEV